jgi:hypothetical protein
MDFPSFTTSPPSSTAHEGGGCSCCAAVTNKKQDLHPYEFLSAEEKLLIEETKAILLQPEASDDQVVDQLHKATRAGLDPTLFVDETLISERIEVLLHLVYLGAALFGTNRFAVLAIQHSTNDETLIKILTVLVEEGSMIDYAAVEYLARLSKLTVLQQLSALFARKQIVYRRWLGAAKRALDQYDTKDSNEQDLCRQTFRFCVEEALQTWLTNRAQFEEYGTEESGNVYSIGYVKRLLKEHNIHNLFHPAEAQELETFICSFVGPL